MIVTELLVGAIVGLIISTTGVGGGIIILPILTYFWFKCPCSGGYRKFPFDVDEDIFIIYAF